MAKGQRKAILIAIVVVAVAILAVFWQTTDFGFISMDDLPYVSGNPWITHGITSSSLGWAMTAIYQGTWQPLVWISYMMDYQIAGLDPGQYHLTNVILHLLATVLLYIALNMLTRKPWRSLFVAALFGLHPIHVEPVAWISSRKDVLSTVFFLLATIAHISYTNRRNIWRYTLVCAAFALGLMSKPMLIALPFVLLLLDFWPLGRFGNTEDKAANRMVARRLILEKLPLLLMAVASTMMTYYAQAKAGGVGEWNHYALGIRVANALVAYVSYMAKTIWPAHLAAYYPHPIDTLPVWKSVLSAALLLALTVGAVRMRKSAPYLLVGWAWYVIVLAPYSGLVQFGGHAMADRFSYVPLIGLFIAVAWMLPSACERIFALRAFKIAHGLLACLSVVILLLCVLVSYKQTGYWRSATTLWEHALSVTQHNGMAHDCLGQELYDDGRYDEALAHYRLAAKYNPNLENPACHITNALLQLGRTDEALTQAREVIRRFPRSGGEYLILANIEASRGNAPAAIALLRKAAGISPTNALVLANYGTMLASQGNLREGVRQLRKALEYAPDNEEIQSNLAHFQQLLGEE